MDFKVGVKSKVLSKIKMSTVLSFFAGFVLGVVSLIFLAQFHALARRPKPEEEDESDLYPPFPTVTSDLKMMLLVRMDLKMKAGKKCAQCAHAAVGILKRIQKRAKAAIHSRPDPQDERAVSERQMRIQHQHWVDVWSQTGVAKIALKIRGEEALVDILDNASQAGLPVFVVRDAGRTQIPAGSVTVGAIGPVPSPLVDRFTRDLKLL